MLYNSGNFEPVIEDLERISNAETFGTRVKVIHHDLIGRRKHSAPVPDEATRDLVKGFGLNAVNNLQPRRRVDLDLNRSHSLNARDFPDLVGEGGGQRGMV